jgi:hypothetical protein
MFFKSAIVGSALLISSSAMAGGYGPAGCGVGTMLLGNDATGLMGGVAQYINMAFWGPTSITLGIMNCGDNVIAALDAEGMDFVVTNRDQLIEDSAKNVDDNFVVLAKLIECNDEAAFVSALHQDHTVFMGSDVEVYTKISQVASNSCTVTL